jgi:hypothetical protein
MYQKDYILRMIEMFGDLIAGILGLIKKGEFTKAGQSLDNAYDNFLKQDSSFFQKIPPEQLTTELLQKHNYTHGHLEILAGLFHAEGELLFAREKPDECLIFYEKSLILFEFLSKETKTFSLGNQMKISSIQEKINELKKMMNEMNHQKKILRNLLRIKGGRWDSNPRPTEPQSATLTY